MELLRWTLNALVRTWRSLSARRATPDDAFAQDQLTGVEFELYLRMDPRDRAHATEVAREVMRRHPEASPTLIRAALLHDLGKAVRPYRLWERVLVHLWAPADIPSTPRLEGVRGAWQVRVHHAAYGAEMLRRADASEDVARLIEQHHAPDAGPDARKIREVDRLR